MFSTSWKPNQSLPLQLFHPLLLHPLSHLSNIHSGCKSSEGMEGSLQRAGTHHTPAVASYKVNTVIKDCTARATAALQNRSLEDIPLVTFWIVAFHQHYVEMRETWVMASRKENVHYGIPINGILWFVLLLNLLTYSKNYIITNITSLLMFLLENITIYA